MMFRKVNPDEIATRPLYDQPSTQQPDLLQLYRDYGKKLDIHPGALRAWAVVETDERGFSTFGRPHVWFDAAVWRRHRIPSSGTKAFDRCLNAVDLDDRWRQLNAMREIQEDPAICAHGFGLFQIRGYAYLACQCANPITFLTEMLSLEGQFRMMEELVRRTPPLLDALRIRDAERVAANLYGKDWRARRYDQRWASASKAGGENVWA